MKLYFENAENLKTGIGYVCEELGIELSEDGICVSVKETEETAVSVSLSGKNATITYGGGKARFFRGLATLCGWIRDGISENEKTETPLFETNGAMIDMSRNVVLKVEQVKVMMRKMALMGMNMYMLYTEDTYEIEGRPYFGYLRGAYTKAELKEMDSYALDLGIELIPCIQMLGHMARHLGWSAATPYRDTQNALLVGADATYALIKDMLKTVTECFTTKRIHVGMDETHDLGTGRYLDLNGYRERQEIYFEHIGRICEIMERYGLKPMMWSDMFFRLSGKNLENFIDYDMRVELDDSIREKVPPTMQQVFWDYYHDDEEFYAVNIDKHQKYLDENMMFAGGVWLWSGHVPRYKTSLENTLPALEACKKKGVKEVLATAWLNGGENHLMLCLPGLAWYADFDYTGSYDIDSVRVCFKNSCGLSYDDFFLCDLLDRLPVSFFAHATTLLFNDPLIGIADAHIDAENVGQYFREVSEKILATAPDKGFMEPAYRVMTALSAVLENKADFGLRLKAAYDKKDNEKLSKLLAECDIITEKLQKLKDTHRAAWMYYNKPFGWEVLDIRYGGHIARFESVKMRVSDYLSGRIAHIEELEAERLSCKERLWRGFQPLASVNGI